MYIPTPFQFDDPSELHAFIREHPFATLVSTLDGAPFATHLPLRLQSADGGALQLIGHVARPNPHWRAFDGRSRSLAIFHGPHAYVSPAWYQTRPAVPTWNYATVHAYGPVSVIESPVEFAAEMDALLREYEQAPAIEGVVTEEIKRRMLPGIVGLRMQVEKLEGKRKLSQNRPEADRQRVADRLAAGDSQARAVAELMRHHVLSEGS
ncbi:MAG TPA: FMN-binding negative transcriptional regulator [Burkholderiaceae bacterium]|jgi:transcriptional regulator|nr:FMN-binding negative transcriptional regulator [Burkholderiaceae bacterium]